MLLRFRQMTQLLHQWSWSGDYVMNIWLSSRWTSTNTRASSRKGSPHHSVITTTCREFICKSVLWSSGRCLHNNECTRWISRRKLKLQPLLISPVTSRWREHTRNVKSRLQSNDVAKSNIRKRVCHLRPLNGALIFLSWCRDFNIYIGTK